MRCTLATAFGIAALAVMTPASAEVLGAPRLVTVQPAVPFTVLTLGDLGAGEGIFDLRNVQKNPVMRARRDFSLMAALPTSTGSAPPLVSLRDLVEPQRFKLGRDVMLTFPLALTSKSWVTAEIAGKGQIAIDSTGFTPGGVFTFKGAF